MLVRRGDDPHELARNFVKTHQLHRCMVNEIETAINNELTKRGNMQDDNDQCTKLIT